MAALKPCVCADKAKHDNNCPLWDMTGAPLPLDTLPPEVVQAALLLAEAQRDEAVKYLLRIGEELVNAGYPPGDRDVILGNVRALIRSADDKREMKQPFSKEGEGMPCKYCEQPCSVLAGDPARWPILLQRGTAWTGVVEWCHAGCVSKRLTDHERAYQMLEANGVGRERARSVANGIDVLTTRFRRFEAASEAVTGFPKRDLAYLIDHIEEMLADEPKNPDVQEWAPTANRLKAIFHALFGDPYRPFIDRWNDGGDRT